MNKRKQKLWFRVHGLMNRPRLHSSAIGRWRGLPLGAETDGGPRAKDSL